MKIGEQMVWTVAYAASFVSNDQTQSELNRAVTAVEAADRALEGLKLYERETFVTARGYGTVCEMLQVLPREKDYGGGDD